MTQRRKTIEFCLGVAFLIAAPALISALVLGVWSALLELPKGYPLLVPLVSFCLAAWYRFRHYPLSRRMFVAEVAVAVFVAPVLFVVLTAVIVALAGGIG